RTPQIGVAPIDWSTFGRRPLSDAMVSFLSVVAPEARGTFAENHAAHNPSRFLQPLAAASMLDRWDLLRAYVRREVARALGFAPESSLDLNQGFFDLGMDSLTSLELKNRIQREVGVALPSTLLFDYPTGETLARYLAEHVLSDFFVQETSEKRTAHASSTN